jgi:hypothetical protein
MAGRISGRTTTWLHRPLYCVLTSSLYFGFCWLLWRPIPLELSPGARLFWLVPGAFMLFTGWGLVLWARLTLGKFYFVSTAFGAQISGQHHWATHGPFALIRHPIYLVILLIGLGGILIYRTWTMVFIALHFVLLVRRTTREEEALDAEFGEQWQAYCKQTPRSIPRFSWRGGIITTSLQYPGVDLHPWVDGFLCAAVIARSQYRRPGQAGCISPIGVAHWAGVDRIHATIFMENLPPCQSPPAKA